MTRPSTFYFDIESGGFKARRNPLISVSFAERQRKVQSKFAVPTEGTYLSAWAEQVVVSETLNKKRTSEKEVLMKFLNVLEGAPEDSKLIGWNIGYTPHGQDIARGTGFDVPFLIDRAREYGLEKRYQKAFKRVKLHDEGATWAYRIAKSVEEKGSKMVQEGRLEETLFTEAVGYMKKARHLTHQQGLESEREIVRALSKEDIRFAGWKQESIFKQLFGHTRTGRRLLKKAHESEADVKMLRMIRQARRREINEEFLETWGKETLENKIVSSVKYGGGRSRYLELMQQAEEWGVKEGAVGKLRQLSEASKVPWYAVESGHGILQGERLVREQIVSETAGKAGFRHLAGVLDEVIPFISRNRGKIGLAAGAGALILMNRGNVFSGKDDEYNVLEGLPHGGMAERMRHMFTDFGSPVNLAKAAMRAEKLYKGLIGGALKKQGIKDVRWDSVIDEGSITILAKSKTGDPLVSVGRELEEGGVYLTNIDISKQLKGGIGRDIYKGEADIFKKIGYEAGETVTSTVSNPITARWQMQKYGSEFTSARQQQIFEATGIGSQQYKEAVIAKKIAKEDFIGGELTGVIPGKDDAYNTIEGLRHRGFTGRLRKLLTPFGSGWDALRNLAKSSVGETFEAMIKSKEFKGALLEATPQKVLGEGVFGTAHLMQSTFRGEQFQFVRKIGKIGKYEVQAGKAIEESVGATIYSQKPGQIDMEVFSGRTLNELSVEEIKQVSKQQIENVFSKLHEKGFVHGDPHLGNIMLAETPSGPQLGLIDLGAAAPPRSSLLPSSDIETALSFRKAKIEGTSMLEAVDPFAAQPMSISQAKAILEASPTSSPVKNMSPDDKTAILTKTSLKEDDGFGAALAKLDTDGDFFSPVNLTKAANKASKMFKSKPGGIASRQQSSIIEANNAKMNRKQKMQQFHRKAQVQQSSYSLRPGKRHRGQAGRLIN